MSDKKMAWVLVTLTTLGILGFWCILAFTDIALSVAGDSSIDQCLAMESTKDCKVCCLKLGGTKGACGRECAHRERHVSPSGF